MKKLLLIGLGFTLLIVGCVFGDTIKYKSNLFVTDTKENVKILGVGKNQNICYQTNDGIDCVPCKSVKEVSVGGVILGSSNDFDCNKQTYYGKQPQIENNLTLKQSLTRFGIMSIFLITVVFTVLPT